MSDIIIHKGNIFVNLGMQSTSFAFGSPFCCVILLLFKDFLEAFGMKDYKLFCFLLWKQ